MSRVSDEEFFTRLLYYGVVQLNLSIDETVLMPLGLLLDLLECHKQYNGLAKPKMDLTIDDIIPYGV
ncbi:MAG TPA: hypothetical protein OIM34_01905 [Ruminococcus bromii]|nr:hypothetical protein [Ruminococcus bromii]